MIELHTTKDIEKISLEILKASKSWDVLPTPVDRIVSFRELVVRDDIDISTIHESYKEKTCNILRKAVSKIRGILDRRHRIIYLDLSKMSSRKNFVKLHEVGHEALTWQKEIYEILEDDDISLNDYHNEEFEAEANYFASVTLFQHDRFISELNKLILGIESAMQLSKLFGSSVHAALRRYVECSANRCALIVLENMSPHGSFPKCSKRDLFLSNKFSETFGNIELPDELGYKWAFVKDYYHKKKFKLDGLISLSTENGEADFHYHFFDNSYNAFVFLFPVGEKKSSRTKIIISESI
ncbi:MAG: ImmA/IrrE family metallo-endopeptidase [Chitinophagaceae bacterium]